MTVAQAEKLAHVLIARGGKNAVSLQSTSLRGTARITEQLGGSLRITQRFVVPTP
jgi:hypothetical protein